MKKITLSVLRADAKVGTTETKKGLAEVLPKGSFVVVKPDGSDARSDMEVGTLRELWAAKEKTTVEAYREAGVLNPVVQIKDNGPVGALKDRLAQGLGLPPASVELRAPGGTKVKAGVHYSTFLQLWKDAGKKK
jgi:hypothetical protein